jgi:Zn-finger nucleic acid-binding protein
MNCSNCGAAMALMASRRYFLCGHCGAYHFPETVAADGVRIVGQLPDAPNCPTCAIALAHALLDEEHPIDFCAKCRGILLPRTSFALVTQKRRAWATSPPAEPFPLNREELRRQIACPKCRRPFATYAHSGPGNVVIDNCARCDIIWLDFGEMRQIVDAPGRDRGSREIPRVDEEYVRRGPDGTDRDDAEEESREARDPLRVLADVLFG